MRREQPSPGHDRPAPRDDTEDGAAPTQVTQRCKRITLVAAILGTGIVFLDSTVVNVALPAIRDDLGAGLAAQQWVIEAYLLTLASLLLIGGSLGDLLGRRRVFAAGLAGFGVTSLLCAAAPTVELLIAARALQGATGALLVPVTLAIIVATFAEDERGWAIGAWTAWTGLAAVVGPLAGGLLVDLASWRLIFVLSVVPVAIALLLIRQLAAATDLRRAAVRIDFLGAVLGGLGLAGPVFALIEQPTRGWGDPVVLVPLLGGLALLALFLVHERRTRHPMLPLEMFAGRNFSVGNLSTLTLYAGLGAAFFFIIIFVQQVSGYDALEAGLALLPVTIVMLALSQRFGALADRFGPRLFMGAGPLLAGAGLLLLVRMDADVDYVSDLLPAVLLFSLGLAVTVAPLTATVLGGADERRAGIASGVNNAVARVAGLLAIAAVGAVVADRFTASLDARLAGQPLGAEARQVVEQARTRPLVVDVSGVPAAEQTRVERALSEASVSGFRLGMGLSGGLVILGGLISVAGIRNPHREVECGDCPGGAIVGASRDAAAHPARAVAAVTGGDS